MKEFEEQYRNHLSDYRTWQERDHADTYLVFPENCGTHLSLDEVAISKGELYTILTNKANAGKKGALVATAEGTKASEITEVYRRIPDARRRCVTEVTIDLSPSMERLARDAFPRARITADRFHVQQLVMQDVQDLRVDLRRDALQREREARAHARDKKRRYTPHRYANGDTERELLARSNHLLFKPEKRWTPRQAERAKILFSVFPTLKRAYDCAMNFRAVYEQATGRTDARARFMKWIQTVEEHAPDVFASSVDSLRNRIDIILNYFAERSTNAGAESFNAKLKNFRAVLRGVRDIKFFFFRVAKLYA